MQSSILLFFGEHRTLGQRNYIHIPECIVTFICSLCPDENNKYTCFRDIDKDGNEAPDDSFESSHPDVQGGNINFEAGERVKICMPFDNKNFDISQVQKFIAESPVEGWSMTFCGDTFTDATMLCSMNETWHKVFVYCMMNDNH